MSNSRPLTLRIPARKKLKRKRSVALSDDGCNDGRKTSDNASESPESSEPQLTVEKEFCNFCGDHMGDQFNQCVDCGGYMCEQKVPDGPGCIWVGTLDRKIPFRCIVCEPRHWRKMADAPKGDDGCLPYGFTGYGGRKRSKLTWPMVLATFTLAGLPDKYMQKSLWCDFEVQYMSQKQNLFLLKGNLSENTNKKDADALPRGAEFIARSVRSNVPANTFIVIDTHSEERTGRLQWTDRARRPMNSPASEVVHKFVGQPLLEQAKGAAVQARLCIQPGSARSWYDGSPFSRGGWRVLFLATCAPVMRIGESFADVRGLVERYVICCCWDVGDVKQRTSDVFDFVLGFAGSSTIPTQVKNAVGRVIERLGVDKTMGLWDTVMSVVGQDLHLLEVNSVVAIFKERGSTEVLSRKIARHAPPMRPWGVEFRACGTPNCDRTTFDFYVQNDGYDVRMTCRACGWKSAWVKERHWGHHVFRLDNTLPTVFWHSYPPSDALKTLFVETSKGNAKDGGGTAEGKVRKHQQ
ncbi:hypothetical protein JVU11DRAFT_7206 [Chiua virens]|nr:hypothetical protein JVU11DRAFT_7206 [Chiua virens]